MEKLIQFIADNGETYGVNMKKAMHNFFAEEFDRLFDQAFSY